MKWWDWIPWSSFSECWVLSQLFHSPLSLSSGPPKFGHRSNKREETQPCPSTENWIKDLLSTALAITTRSSFPHSHSLPSGSFHKPHPYSLRGQTEWKSESQKTNKLITWTTAWSNSVKLWAMPCRATQHGSWWRGLTKHDPLEKGMANHFSILALRTPWTVWKGKKIWHWKRNSKAQ